jgi:outer membrane protein assembly factor BamD (BamD/ComL family)
MKRLVLILICGLIIPSNFGNTLYSLALPTQGGVSRGPDPTVLRDPELERDSIHNLDVARQYFNVRKAYKAVVSRCEEILVSNPNFSKLDEVLYLAGMSSLRLSENKGKQSSTESIEKLRRDAIEYLSRIAEEFPQSSFKETAEKELKLLGWTKKDNK